MLKEENKCLKYDKILRIVQQLQTHLKEIKIDDREREKRRDIDRERERERE